MAKATGIGGIFIKFYDPEGMRKWYADVLGLVTNPYGVLFEFNGGTSDTKGYLQLGTFESNSDYFGSDKQRVMINFRVDNMEELLKDMQAKKVHIVNEIQTYEYGKFLHIEDPEGNRIELWEPIDASFEADKGPKTPMT